MNAREGPSLIGQAVRVLRSVMLSAAARVMPEAERPAAEEPPRLIVVLTPNSDWFRDAVEAANPGKVVRQVNGDPRALTTGGPTIYRHIRNMRQAQGCDRLTPLMLARWWHYCEESGAILDRFQERVR